MKKDINLYKQGENLIVYINELPKNNEYWVYEMPVGTLDGEMCKNKLPLSWFEKLHDKDCYKTVIASSQKIEDIPQISKSDEAEWNRRDCPKNAKALCEEHFTKDGTYHLELSPDGCIIIDWGDAQPNKKEELRTEFATETMKISYNSTIEKKADIEIIENENQISISKVFINWSLEVIGTSHHCNIRLSIDSITAYGTQGEAEEAMEIKILPEHCVITKEDTKIGDDIFPHLITIDCSINTAVIEF